MSKRKSHNPSSTSSRDNFLAYFSLLRHDMHRQLILNLQLQEMYPSASLPNTITSDLAGDMLWVCCVSCQYGEIILMEESSAAWRPPALAARLSQTCHTSPWFTHFNVPMSI
jgi:hypothetical protein